MKICELCKLAATVYCEPDGASLCWGCDRKVHGANFLVARHVRWLLCRKCQSLTPWSASGSNLCHDSLSFCDTCNRNYELNTNTSRKEGNLWDGDNQVVPLASGPAVSCSSDSSTSSGKSIGWSVGSTPKGGEFSEVASAGCLERSREGISSAGFPSLPQGEIERSSSQGQKASTDGNGEASYVDYSLRKRKRTLLIVEDPIIEPDRQAKDG